MSVKIYRNADEFFEDADWPMYAIRSADYVWWLAWSNDYGDWFASRGPHEDDPIREDDPYRPVGPVPIETVPLPWVAVALDDLAAIADELAEGSDQ